MTVSINNLAPAGTASTTDMFYAGQQMIQSVQQQPSSPSNGETAVTTQYVFSPRYVDSPILFTAMTSTYDAGSSSWSTTSTDTYYYLTDANYNVTTLLNSSGGVVERYVYSAYGTPTIYNSTYSATYSTSAAGNTILFAGMDMDPVTGFYITRSRLYDSVTDSFVTPDPAQQGLNFYAYANSDPIDFTDPTGLAPGPRGASWSAPDNSCDGDVDDDYTPIYFAMDQNDNPTFVHRVWRLAVEAGIPTGVISRKLFDLTVTRNGGLAPMYRVKNGVFSVSRQLELPSDTYDRVLQTGEGIGVDGRPLPVGTGWGNLIHELFHAYMDQVVYPDAAGGGSSSWLTDLMKKEPYPKVDEPLLKNQGLGMAEEAMADLITDVVGSKAAYNSAIDRGESPRPESFSYKSLASYAIPGHGENGECFSAYRDEKDSNGKPFVNIPISRELFYAVFWVLDYGNADPAGTDAGSPNAGQIRAKRLEDNFNESWAGTNWAPTEEAGAAAERAQR